MSCLNFDDLLQLIADDSADGAVREHATSCEACRRTATCVAAVFRHAALYEEFLAGASQKMPSRWARLIAQRVHAAFEAQFSARPTCPSREELFDWVVGAAGCDAAIGAHVGVCVRCQQALGEVSALLNGASQWEVITTPPTPVADEPMPLELSERIFGTVNAAYKERFAARREASVPATRASWRRSLRTSGLVAAAASLLLAVGGVVWQVRNGGVTQLASTPIESSSAAVKLPDAVAAAASVPRNVVETTSTIDRRVKPQSWTQMSEAVAQVGIRLKHGAEPWVAMVRSSIRRPTPEDWSRVAARLAERAKQARKTGRIAEEERLLADALAAAKLGRADEARQAAYGLLLVRSRIDQDRLDTALAAYDEIPAADSANVQRARHHVAARLAKSFHDRGRSAPAVMLLASLDGDLDAQAAQTLANARRAVAAQTTRLVGTGNQALTYKIEHWAQTRLAGSMAQVAR